VEGGKNGGNEWNPCLLMWNYDRYQWAGTLNGHGVTTNSGPMANALFYQARVGVKPTAKLDIMASVSYATADQKKYLSGTTVLENASDKYGTEIDLTGTYKITNNLTYMLGFGYLFTGDYYKGNTSNNVSNDYILINKLTLTF
jgi:hypothetical protein